MAYSEFNRGDLVAVLNHGTPQHHVPHLQYGLPNRPPASRCVWLCSNDSDRESQSKSRFILLIRDDEINDFFAWAVTFLPMFRPLTSFFRVCPWTQFTEFLGAKPVLRESASAVLLGAILGETLGNVEGRGALHTLPLTAFESTYMYTMSRALTIGLSDQLLPVVGEGWSVARTITDQIARRLEQSVLTEAFFVMASILGRSVPMKVVASDSYEAVEGACRELAETTILSHETWVRMSGDHGDKFRAAELLKAAKERRVEAFDRTAILLAGGVQHELVTSFLIAYLASVVSDGSMDHVHLVAPFREAFPTVMLWYGVCAGLSKRTSVWTDYEHLGLRLWQLLTRDDNLWMPPSCDISLAELEIILRGHEKSRTFRQFNASTLRIEVAPLVPTVVRWQTRSESAEQMSLFGTDPGTRVEPAGLEELVGALRKSLEVAEALVYGKKVSGNPQKRYFRKNRKQ